MIENIGIIIVLTVLLVVCVSALPKKSADLAAGKWTCTSDNGDKLSFEIPSKREGACSTRTAGGNIMGYDQVTSPEQFAVVERTKSRMVGDDWNPDSRDQASVEQEVVAPSWGEADLLYFGAVDAQTIQNHQEFTSGNWMFNQNAAFADFGDNPNYPYPVTSIRLNAINNVPTDSNPHQITEDQDDGGAMRNTYTDKKICYGTV
jgi:hypothetical protein